MSVVYEISFLLFILRSHTLAFHRISDFTIHQYQHYHCHVVRASTALLDSLGFSKGAEEPPIDFTGLRCSGHFETPFEMDDPLQIKYRRPKFHNRKDGAYISILFSRLIPGRLSRRSSFSGGARAVLFVICQRWHFQAFKSEGFQRGIVLECAGQTRDNFVGFLLWIMAANLDGQISPRRVICSMPQTKSERLTPSEKMFNDDHQGLESNVGMEKGNALLPQSAIFIA
jgi:hypothetical protein